MWRRTMRLIVILTLTILAAPLGAEAQRAAKVPRVGILNPASPASGAPSVAAFRQSLGELGYIDGTNIGLEVRFSEGRHERLSVLASELVRLKVDVIVAGSTPGALAAKNATDTIPIAIVTTGDPVAR